MDMALMCDMRFASETMSMAASYVRLAVVPGDGGCYYLPRLVGPAKALELLLSGDPVGADDAERMGLVNRVYPDDRLLGETLAFARRLAAGPPVAVRLIKRTVYQSSRTDLATALALAGSHMGVVMTMSDHAEGVAALREQRAASFTGQ
jgi:enoyl-CoA hydratase/carnithine racemase